MSIHVDGGKPLTNLVMVVLYDGEPDLSIGTVTTLASAFKQASYGGIEVQVGQLLALDGTELVPVTFEIDSRRGFTADDWMPVTVTVTLPDGMAESASYLIDGRA